MAEKRKSASSGLNPWQRGAVLLVALGEEVAAEVLQHFEEDEMLEIARAIADLKNIPPEMQDQVLLEFEDSLEQGAPASGGPGFARGLLEQALGPERARQMLEKLQAGRASGFRLLKDADAAQVAPFIAQEHPQTIALILSQLEPAQAAAMLGHFPAKLQTEVSHRIATLEHISPEILQEVEKGLAATLQDVLGGKREVGGPEVVANMLNLAGARLEKSLLERLDGVDPELAEEIRNRMFVFDDLGGLGDAEIRMLMRHIDPKDLMVALKAAGKGVRDRFFTNMSERQRARFLEDMDALPPMRLSQVEEVQTRLVRQVRQLEEQEIIRLPRGDDEDTFV